VFEARHDGLALETTFFADRDEAVKLVHVRVHNPGAGARRLRALAMAEWQLGDARGTRRTVHCWKPEDQPAVFGEQRESGAGFGGSTAFLMLAGLQGINTSSTTGATQWTCDRNEFFGGHGGVEVPDTLARRAGSGLDACAAIGGEFVVAAGETPASASCWATRQRRRRARAGAPLAPARRARGARAGAGLLERTARPAAGAHARPAVRRHGQPLAALPDVACRLWSKAGFYQAGGAFGFRDQLQDAMALRSPTRRGCASRSCCQRGAAVPEGDVQHWWHACPAAPACARISRTTCCGCRTPRRTTSR
jgi:cyclic beta-1,2-glucan synthetase